MNYFNYFSEIEDTFVRRRGKHLFLSPLDWAMIDGWKERGIPLHIVLRAIEAVFDVFDRQPAGTRTIKSLFYCREEVETQFGEWQTSQTGKSKDSQASGEPEFTVESIARHIEKVTGELDHAKKNGMVEDLDRAIARLNEIKINLSDNFETIDKTLGDVEKLLDRAMLQNWDALHLKNIERDISSALKAYKSEMEPDKYRQTYELMVMKRLREEAGIPRLGLYYL